MLNINMTLSNWKMTQLSPFLRLLQNTEALSVLNTVFVHTEFSSQRSRKAKKYKNKKGIERFMVSLHMVTLSWFQNRPFIYASSLLIPPFLHPFFLSPSCFL